MLEGVGKHFIILYCPHMKWPNSFCSFEDKHNFLSHDSKSPMYIKKGAELNENEKNNKLNGNYQYL